MSNEPTPSVAQLRQQAETAGVLDHPKVQRVLQQAALTQNDQILEVARRVIQQQAVQHAAYPFTEHDGASHGVPLGATLQDRHRFHVREHDLTRHAAVLGQSGMGKTSLLYLFAVRTEVPVWLFDLKTDYRHLVTELDDLLVVPWEILRVNPLRPPPGVNTATWRSTVTQLFGEAFGLAYASQSYFARHLRELYDRYGVAEATGDRDDAYPCLPDLDAYIREEGETGQTRQRFKERVSDRLGDMATDLDATVACSAGFRFDQLLHRNVVFELDGLRKQYQDFLMEWALAWIFQYRQSRQDRGDQLRHLTFFDEGKRAFARPKEQSDVQGIPTIDALTAQLREFGEGIVVGDQEPDKLTRSILANTDTTVLFRLGTDDAFRRVADSIGLDDGQRRRADELLDVGRAVVRYGSRPPTLVDLDHLDVSKTVTDERLADRQRDRWQAAHGAVEDRVAVSDLDDQSEPAVTSSSSSAGAESVESGVEPGADDDTAGESHEPDLSERALHLLEDIAAHPFEPVTDRYQRVGWTRYKGDKARKALEREDLVDPVAVPVGRGTMKLFDVTARGRTVLGERDVTVDRVGRGGLAHQFWQHQIVECVESFGAAAEREEDDADVAVEHDDARVAVEVAMGNNQREVEHVEKHLDGDFDTVVVVCRTPAVREKLCDRVEAETAVDTERVMFRLVRDFYEASSLPL